MRLCLPNYLTTICTTDTKIEVSEKQKKNMNTENKKKWTRIAFDIVKYAAAAVLGGLGISAIDGCQVIPQFIF